MGLGAWILGRLGSGVSTSSPPAPAPPAARTREADPFPGILRSPARLQERGVEPGSSPTPVDGGASGPGSARPRASEAN